MKCTALMFVAAITAALVVSAFPPRTDCSIAATIAYQGGYELGVQETTEAFMETWGSGQ